MADGDGMPGERLGEPGSPGDQADEGAQTVVDTGVVRGADAGDRLDVVITAEEPDNEAAGEVPGPSPLVEDELSTTAAPANPSAEVPREGFDRRPVEVVDDRDVHLASWGTRSADVQDQAGWAQSAASAGDEDRASSASAGDEDEDRADIATAAVAEAAQNQADRPSSTLAGDTASPRDHDVESDAPPQSNAELPQGNASDGASIPSALEPPAPGRRPRLEQLEREGEVAADFLERLLDIADLDGDIDVDVDGDRAAVAVVDSDEGRVPRRLVGPDGRVLEALQELTRLAVQTATGERSRLMLDVAGFRAERRAALVHLAREAIDEVKQSGRQLALSDMTAFERKVVHDEVTAAGLVSESEGVEPHRHIVILPA